MRVAHRAEPPLFRLERNPGRNAGAIHELPLPANRSTKRRVAHKRSSPSQPALDTFRERIDRIDAQILTLLNRRARLAQRIGNTKGKTGTVYIPSRERAILARLAELNTGPLPIESVQAIYREIISASRALETSLRVAYLGPEASYAHMAGKEQFGAKAEFVPVETIPQIFSTVESGQVDYGVVPVENSSQGSVALTLDLFIETNLHIIAERSLAIRHCLLSRATKRERIQRGPGPSPVSGPVSALAGHASAGRAHGGGGEQFSCGGTGAA